MRCGSPRGSSAGGSRLSLAGLLALALLGAACEASEPAPQEEIFPTAAILHFRATPSPAIRGESIRISWITSHAAAFTLTAGEEALEVAREAWAQGSLELIADAQGPLHLRLEIEGPGGESVVEEREFEILGAPLVAIEAFVAEPARIPAGAHAALSWRTSNATSIRIVDDLGQPLHLGAEAPGEGRLSIRPARSTVYELEALGPTGSTKQKASIEIAREPALVAAASAERVVFGEALLLQWEVAGADLLRIWEGDELLHDAPTSDPEEGELSLQPTQAAVYRLEAIGLGGSAEALIEVGVIPSIVSFALRDAPAKLRPGMEVELGWEVLGAGSLVLSDREGVLRTIEDPSEVAAGSLAVPIRAGGHFELVARSGGEEATATFALELTDAPVIASFGSDSALQSASPDKPALVSLSWEVYGARALFLRASPGRLHPLPPEASGRWELEVHGPTQLELIAENPWGVAQASADAQVLALPAILSFEAEADRVAAGDLATLRWETSCASEVELVQGGALVHQGAGGAGSFTAAIAAETHFELRATNALGDEVRAGQTIALGAPGPASFRANRSHFAPGETIFFDWQTGGAEELELRQDGGPALYSTTDPAQIRSGSLAAPAPSQPGEAGYLLLLRNGAGTSSAGLEVQITEGPIIESFTAHPAKLTTGDEVELRWTVRSGLGGEQPTLGLEDDRGGVHPAGASSVRLPLEAPGTLTFTLRASDAAGESEVQATVEVQPAPELLVAAASPPFADAPGDPVVLAWESAHASALWLFPADDEGAAVGDAVFGTTTEVAAGSFEVRPTLAAPHLRVVLANELGARRSFFLRIGVQPPTITRFEAAPKIIARGEASSLEWETERAAEVRLEAPPWVESSDPFVDLQGLDETVVLGIGLGELHTTLLPFPADFVFPFDGAQRRALRVANAGYLSFDLLVEQGSSTVSTFPAPNHPHIHLAPLLGRLLPGSGQILYALLGEGPLRHLVIQYRGFSLVGEPQALLDFQVVLWPDGSFDYRYGTISHPALVEGGAFLIGAQDAKGQRGLVLSEQEASGGGLAGRSFHFPNVSPGIAVEDEAKPFLSIAGASDAVELTEGSRFFTNALFPFPPDFRFPFAGSLRSAVRITKDGYLSFQTSEEVSHPANRRLAQGAATGPGGSARVVHLAPFWANLSRVHAAGEIWAAIRNDGGGRALVIQWLRFAHEGDPASRLDFEVLLREDGSFEYRYGAMFREAGGLASGALASIGYQEPNGVRGVDLAFREPVAGGLSGRSFRFVPDPSLPLSGALEVRPRASVTYTLRALGATGSHEQRVELEVLPAVGGSASSAPPNLFEKR